jgi:hypothetical protein
MFLLFFESYKCFSVHRAWHFPNMLLPMIYGQAFRIIPCHLPSEGFPLSANQGRTEQFSVDLTPKNFNQYTVIC